MAANRTGRSPRALDDDCDDGGAGFGRGDLGARAADLSTIRIPTSSTLAAVAALLFGVLTAVCT